MRGCMRKLGLVLGILAALTAVTALAFWLYWRHGSQLYTQALDAYHHGNPAQALTTYQEYLRFSSGADERRIKSVQRDIQELEDFLNAAQLQQEGRVDEAIAAYKVFLEDYFSYGYSENIYYFLSHKALASLKPQQAQQYHDQGDFSGAIEVYSSLLAQEAIVEDECPYQGDACQEAETAIQENRDAAILALPLVILHWSQALPQGENYLEFVRSCDRVVQAYPEILSTPDGAFVPGALEEARNELPSWLVRNPASPVLDYPGEVGRDNKGTWVLTTHFREVGGMLGYTLSGSGWIIDAQGEKWQAGVFGSAEISRGESTVPAGGEGENTYRFEGEMFIDGYAIFTWKGEDEGGNPILLEEKVHLLP